MRNLSEITAAARIGAPITEEEMRWALIAYDVLYAQLQTEPQVVFEYMKAASLDPKQYAGWDNDPANPQFMEWYKAMNSVEANLQAQDPSDDE